jgi:hypothetical protein
LGSKCQRFEKEPEFVAHPSPLAYVVVGVPPIKLVHVQSVCRVTHVGRWLPLREAQLSGVSSRLAGQFLNLYVRPGPFLLVILYYTRSSVCWLSENVSGICAGSFYNFEFQYFRIYHNWLVE